MKISEDNFILQIGRRNEAALRYAIEEYGGLVKSVVRKHLYPDARGMFFEECINDVFLGVWFNIGSYQPQKNSFKNWIAAIARFKAIDYGRKYAVIRSHESDEEPETSMSGLTVLADSVDDDMSEQMQRYLSCLSEADRELFMRIYVAEDSVAEVSRDTGMNRDVIYNRLSRGRKKLKQVYAFDERGAK